MSKPDDLTPYAVEGYVSMGNAYISTSPSWYAYKLGAYLKATGRTSPRDVRMGRGYSIRGNDMRFTITHQGDDVAFERVS
jgi:hypothetical protein